MTLEDRAKQYAEKQIKHKMAKHDIFIKEKAEEEIIKVYLAGAKETEMEFEKSLLEKGVCLQSDLVEAKEIIKFAMERIKKIVCEERCDFVNKEFFCDGCSYGKWIAKAEAFLKFEA